MAEQDEAAAASTELGVQDRDLENRILRQLRKRRRARGIYDDEFAPWQYAGGRRPRGAGAGEGGGGAGEEKGAGAGAATSSRAYDSDSDDAKDKAAAFKSDADLLEETLIDLPWPYLRVRLDRINSVSPIDALRYYFVRYSTGFSYAWLLASLAVLAVFMALVISRWIDTGDQFDATFLVGFKAAGSLLSDQPVPDLLNTNTGFRFLFAGNSTINVGPPDRAAEFVEYSFFQCSRTKAAGDGTGPYPSFTETCTDIGTSFRTIDGFPHVCPGADAELEGSFEQDDEDRFVRFELRLCSAGGCAAESDILAALAGGELRFSGFTHAPTEPADADDGVLNIELRRETFPYAAGFRQAGGFEYERIGVTRHARFFVDGVSVHFGYLRGVTRRIVNDADSGPLFAMEFRLLGSQQEVNVLTLGWIEVVGIIASMFFVIRALGCVPWLWNRQHFIWYGEYKSADLPKRYVDRLLDPNVKEPVVGRREINGLRRDHQFTETEFKLRETMKAVTQVRAKLAPHIKEVLRTELLKEERI